MESDFDDEYSEGFQKCVQIYEKRLCMNCKYAKSSYGVFVCDLGVLESKINPYNQPDFGCNKFDKKVD